MREKGFSTIFFYILLALISSGIISGAYYLKNYTKYFSDNGKISKSVEEPKNSPIIKQNTVAIPSSKTDNKKASPIITSTNKIDQSIISVADNFIMNLVGEAEFKNNYRLDVESSDECKDQGQIGGCYIRYTFLPGEKYGKSEYLFFYIFRDKSIQIANNNIPLTLPSCEKDINKCNFKVSLDQLKNIAKEKNLAVSRLVMYENQIVGVLSYCNMETTANRKKVYVDLQDGSILWEGPNSECQGIV